MIKCKNLTFEQRKEIFHASGTLTSIAKEFGVSRTVVTNIKTGKYDTLSQYEVYTLPEIVVPDTIKWDIDTHEWINTLLSDGHTHENIANALGVTPKHIKKKEQIYNNYLKLSTYAIINIIEMITSDGNATKQSVKVKLGLDVNQNVLDMIKVNLGTLKGKYTKTEADERRLEKFNILEGDKINLDNLIDAFFECQSIEPTEETKNQFKRTYQSLSDSKILIGDRQTGLSSVLAFKICYDAINAVFVDKNAFKLTLITLCTSKSYSLRLVDELFNFLYINPTHRSIELKQRRYKERGVKIKDNVYVDNFNFMDVEGLLKDVYSDTNLFMVGTGIGNYGMNELIDIIKSTDFEFSLVCNDDDIFKSNIKGSSSTEQYNASFPVSEYIDNLDSSTVSEYVDDLRENKLNDQYTYTYTDTYVMINYIDDGKIIIKQCSSGSSVFGKVHGLLSEGKVHEAFRSIDVVDSIVELSTDLTVDKDLGKLFFKGNEIKQTKLVKWVLSNLESESDKKYSLINFFSKLALNPSKESIDSLYDWVALNKIEITKTGDMIGYRSVTNDLMDKRTKTFDNSVGSTVAMPRQEVDDNRGVGCGKGLHVGSYPYAKGFSSVNDKIVQVHLNPMNVVSVPKDCNCQKVRCCEFEVVSVVE